MLHRIRSGLVPGIAVVALLAHGVPAWAANDPCAGGLVAAQIVDCLKPDGLSAATRGIRPTAPKPGAPATPPPAASQGLTVNLLVPFAYDSAEMTAQGAKVLDALAAALKDPALAGARFEIAGHTDASGTDAYNMALSERRAQTARSYLVDKDGIEPARLTAVGYGRTRLYDVASPTAAVNRRVQVTRLP